MLPEHFDPATCAACPFQRCAIGARLDDIAALVHRTKQACIPFDLQLISQLGRSGAKAVAPTAEATEAFENERRAAAQNTIWMSGCNSWYLDATGVPASWTFSYDRFVDEMNAPDLSAFVLS